MPDPRPDELILRIYDAALDPVSWPDVLQEVSHYCNARGAFIFGLEGDPLRRTVDVLHYSAIHRPEIVEAYLKAFREAEVYDHEFFASRSHSSDRIEMIPDDDLVAEYEAKGGLFNQPHLRMQIEYGFQHRAGAVLNKDDYYRDRIGILFSTRHGPVTAEDLRRGEQLLPHLAKALNLSRPAIEAQARHASLTAALDRIALGLAVLDRRGRVVYANAEMRRQEQDYPAFHTDPDGRLRFDPDHVGPEIAALLSRTDAHGRFGGRPRKEAVTAITDSANGFGLCIEVTPLRKADALGEMQLDGHIVYSLDTSRAFAIRGPRLKELFGLTRSETAVLELMAEGLTNQQISEQRCKSVHTINTQVKSVLAKMQAANRTQLIRLATNLSSSLVES